MNENRPFMVTIIGDGCILCAFLLIVSLFHFWDRFGIIVKSAAYMKVPFIPEDIVTLLYAIFLLIIAYGYLKLKRWGYWLMVSMNLFFIVVWLITFLHDKNQVLAQYPSSIIALIFIIPTIRYFGKKKIELGSL